MPARVCAEVGENKLATPAVFSFPGKPVVPELAEKVRLVTENQFLRERVSSETQLDGIVGSSDLAIIRKNATGLTAEQSAEIGSFHASRADAAKAKVHTKTSRLK